MALHVAVQIRAASAAGKSGHPPALCSGARTNGTLAKACGHRGRNEALRLSGWNSPWRGWGHHSESVWRYARSSPGPATKGAL
jgi:hypothetical protein